MSSNVDDLLYGTLPEVEEGMKYILSAFAVTQTQETEFRFCGNAVQQLDDIRIIVTAKDNTEQIRPIDYGAKKLTGRCTPTENTALRSVVA